VTPAEQLAYFRQGTELLGGQRATAARLNIADRTVRMLLAGDRQLHLGFIRDMHDALIEHGRQCRLLATKIDPMFIANRTEAQRG
jgi:hypothetical protein